MNNISSIFNELEFSGESYMSLSQILFKMFLFILISIKS